jgi:hypothetical protein
MNTINRKKPRIFIGENTAENSSINPHCITATLKAVRKVLSWSFRILELRNRTTELTAISASMAIFGKSIVVL